MTRDVFKYFKHVRSLQEDKGAEKAAELGYQHQARGVYIDPKTQKRYKNVGDKLEPIVVEPTAEKGGGQQKPDTKSLGQFKKDATATQPTALPQIPDGVSDDEFAAAKAKEFTGGRDVTPERKEFLDKVSKTLVALGNRQDLLPQRKRRREIERGNWAFVPAKGAAWSFRQYCSVQERLFSS